jgi:hypothetical protein
MGCELIPRVEGFGAADYLLLDELWAPAESSADKDADLEMS